MPQWSRKTTTRTQLVHGLPGECLPSPMEDQDAMEDSLPQFSRRPDDSIWAPHVRDSLSEIDNVLTSLIDSDLSRFVALRSESSTLAA